MNRRCTVLGTDAKGLLVLQSSDFGLGTAPVSRPMLGSSVSGLHSVPPVGGQVLVLHDGEHMTPVPASAVTASDTLGALPTLAAGETALLHSDGRVATHLRADGSTLLWSKAGTQLKVDSAGHLVSVQASRPTVAPTANAGTGATASVDTVATDLKGLLTLTTGTGTAAGAQLTLTFATSFAAAPTVQLTPATQNAIPGPAGAVGFAVTAVTASALTIATAVAPQASATYQLYYWIIG